MEILRLNLGSGARKFPFEPDHWINSDIISWAGVDVVHDINDPWPWEDNTFDQVVADNVLEHGRDKVHLISELWRVCKPNAAARIYVPVHTWAHFYDDPSHRSCWSAGSLQSCDVDHPHSRALPWNYSPRFKVVRFELIEGWMLSWDILAIKDGDIPCAEAVVPPKGDDR